MTDRMTGGGDHFVEVTRGPNRWGAEKCNITFCTGRAISREFYRTPCTPPRPGSNPPPTLARAQPTRTGLLHHRTQLRGHGRNAHHEWIAGPQLIVIIMAKWKKH
jgi:hypothetical protein